MKVEQVIILPEDVKMSDSRHQQIIANSMEILDDLKLPYRLLQLCT
jgi:seryl-tRNA synthetase